jgi:tyrosinase
MANGVSIRSSVEGIERQPAQLLALRDAYARMQVLSPSDNRSWIFWAGIHGFPQWHCQHHGRAGMWSQLPFNLFLPWHRAYLVYFENAVRDRNPNASLPWWDWTSPMSRQIGVPRSFAEPWVGNLPNPLFNGPVPAMAPDPPRQTVRFPGAPADLPTQGEIESLLELTSFSDFQLQLEDFHDRLHGWAGGTNFDPNSPRGGDMGVVARAAYDPLFFSHHCMIDRLWYLWQLRQGVANIPPDYLDRSLPPFSLTVRDVLDIRRLGYEYAQSFSASIAGPTG